MCDTLDAISDDVNRFQKEHLTEEKIRNFKQFINFVPDCWFTVVEINLSLIFLRHRISLSPCIFRMILIHLQHSFLSFVVFFMFAALPQKFQFTVHCTPCAGLGNVIKLLLKCTFRIRMCLATSRTVSYNIPEYIFVLIHNAVLLWWSHKKRTTEKLRISVIETFHVHTTTAELYSMCLLAHLFFFPLFLRYCRSFMV